MRAVFCVLFSINSFLHGTSCSSFLNEGMNQKKKSVDEEAKKSEDRGGWLNSVHILQKLLLC